MSGPGDPVKGWCPGALRPMESGDGLILRVRPRLSRLSLVQLETLGHAAQRFGSGSLHLSNRANVLIRGMTAAGHAAALEVLAAANLIDCDPHAEAVRNIMLVPMTEANERLSLREVSQLGQRGQGSGQAFLLPWGEGQDEGRYAENEGRTPSPCPSPSKLAPASLPLKVAISASGYGGRGDDVAAAPSVGQRSNVCVAGGLAAKLEHLLTKTEALYRLPSKFGIAVQAGYEIDTAALSDVTFVVQEDQIAMLLDGAPGCAAAFSGTQDAVDAFLRAALVFLRLRDASPDIRRMRDAVDRFGLEAIAKEARLAPVEHGLQLTEPPAPTGDLGEAFGIAFTFGEIRHSALQEITRSMRRQSIPEAALSPRRALVFPVQERDKPVFQELAQRIGGITSPGDLRLRVHACPGAPACSRATVAARRDAEAILAALGKNGLPKGALHISGCGKRCAYPHDADITAIGAQDGRYTLAGPHGQMRAPVAAGELAGVVAELAGAL